jgi:hypothetical protein
LSLLEGDLGLKDCIGTLVQNDLPTTMREVWAQLWAVRREYQLYREGAELQSELLATSSAAHGVSLYLSSDAISLLCFSAFTQGSYLLL